MTKGLRIIFIGTPDFAVESLKCLYEDGKNIVAVITAPDRKAGRGRKVNESAVKKFALAKGLDVLQPTNLKDPNFIENLKAFQADIQVVVAFRMLPEVVWNMPRLGTFNLHASLLPNYRGAAPINWAIINGESESGVTTFFLKHKIDTGDVIFQEKVAIVEGETAGSLHDKLMNTGGKLILKTIEAIESGIYETSPQESFDHQKLKEAPKIYKDDGKINWNKSANEIDRLIRGLSPYPTAWTKLMLQEEKEIQLKIYSSAIDDQNIRLKPAEILVKEQQLFIGTKDAALRIDELQLEGKKRMNARALLNGFDFGSCKIT